MIVNLGIINGAAISINRGPAPKKQWRPLFHLQTPRDGSISPHCDELFLSVIGSNSSFLFEETVERSPKIFLTG